VNDADLEMTDKVTAIMAGAVMRRFNVLTGGHHICSTAVFVAASQVLRIVFTADEPFRALDDFEALEASLRKAVP
jgi:hypothetical protein